MTVAKILRWMKSIGDRVQAGEILLEIETDKVNYGIESPAGGVLKTVLVNVGDKVPVGGVVAVIGEADEEIDIGLYRQGEVREAIPDVVLENGTKEAIVWTPKKEGVRISASPLVKKVAREKSIDLSLIKGTGRSGRIRMEDLERYLAESIETEAEPTLPTAPEVSQVIPMTTMRSVIARRLSQSFHDAPHINLCVEVDMTEAMRLEALLRKRTEEQAGVRLSLNDIFIKAVAVALRNNPLINARLNEERIEILRDINIGLAVALDDGLIVPAVERADRKMLWEIAKERKDLVDRARQGRLSLSEIERGTFTISNLGMYDIVFFTSIVNPPQSGILSVGKILDRPVVRDGEIVIRAVAEISLAVDHRVVDGAVGAKFLQELKKGLEDLSMFF
jgi:pyruvate dehydrogenase E2 component (dihydrolipoamide acetyltransferase)